MTTASKSTKKAAKPKRITREPIIGRVARSGPWGAFAFELQSFTLNGEPIDPQLAADDLARALLWIIKVGIIYGSN